MWIYNKEIQKNAIKTYLLYENLKEYSVGIQMFQVYIKRSILTLNSYYMNPMVAYNSGVKNILLNISWRINNWLRVSIFNKD